MALRKDLTGKQFGHLVVVEHCGSKNNRMLWTCRCECGNVTEVDTHSLTSGNTKSCGCRKYGGRLSHGEAKDSQTRLYRIWSGMKNRCANESHIGFHLYGGKGIRVCDEWKSFENFRNWANQNGYNDSLTIDRIDSSRNYEPNNCRWVTYKKQSNNTTRNHFVTAFDTIKTISEWSDVFGVPQRTIAARVNLLGWCPEDAVSVPVRGRRAYG